MPRAPRPVTGPFSSEVVLAREVASATLSTRASRGELRRLTRGVYTTNLEDPVEDVVRRNRWVIVAALFPGAVISDRSALPVGQDPDILFLVHDGRARDVALPGLLVRARSDHGPIEGDQPLGELPLHQASLARALVDNTRPSRSRGGRVARTVDRASLEEVLVGVLRRDGEARLTQLRDEAQRAGGTLGHPDGAALVTQIIDALLGEAPAYVAASRTLRAQLEGAPYDQDAVARFDLLRDELIRLAPELRGAGPLGELPFFEAYFSNFIEGTEFELDEARRIIVEGWDPVDRPADAHDVRCAFTIVSDLEEMSRIAADADMFIALLRERHRVLLASRPDKRPGRFKEEDNRAGGTTFVAHELVVGTLREGFARLASLSDPFQRAAFVMFLIAEVHPFDDGNGRLARVFMNCELAAAGQQRIVIPPVFRDDYLGALRALSRSSNPTPLQRMLAFAQDVARRVDWTTYDDARRTLEDANAFLTPDEAEDTGQRLRLP
ncbi:MAG: Fic family protein [Dehalococcoidia bacterium]